MPLLQRIRTFRDRIRIQRSFLFDPNFYLAHYPDVAQSGMNPLTHYLRYGGTEGRDPHSLFSGAYYLAHYPDVAQSGMNPLTHYLRYGAQENRNPNPYFDTRHYVETYPDIRNRSINPLTHYLRYGFREGRRPNPLFDSEMFISRLTGTTSITLDTLKRYTYNPLDEESIRYFLFMQRITDRQRNRLSTLTFHAPDRIMVADGQEEAALSGFVIPPVHNPLVSIIIPFHNNLRLTVECLLSLTRHTDMTRHEIVLVDDASNDRTRRLLSRCSGLTYLRNETGQGFLKSSILGAGAARGAYLLFLNNDTQVTSGWLDALLRPFTESGQVGATGPRLLFPDGKLQEAGALVDPDGVSRMVGIFDNPAFARYSYNREVDYCSGACLLVRREVYDRVGGFDLRYAPAYYEDTDLCLSLRKEGYRTVYVADSVVIHHLNATSEQVGTEFKQVQIIRNRQLFMDEWAGAIDRLNAIRLIAFYLPQFYTTPQNDLWWGKGYTDWTGVASATPMFEGHDQPRLPTDMGFYDLRVPEVMAQQAELARRYGIYGFCFYVYWFDGIRILETPVESMLGPDAPDIPYCLAWANNDWTRVHIGNPEERLLGVNHTDKDNDAAFRHYMRHFRKASYIRVDGKPLFLVYQVDRFPDIRKTTTRWRRISQDEGVGEIYLVMFESFGFALKNENPSDYGFDASVEFPPHGLFPQMERPPGADASGFSGTLHRYQDTALAYIERDAPGFTRFRGVMPSWDNTARYRERATVFSGSSPGLYRAWLETAIEETRRQNFGEERMIFINGWNEWGEGCVLEPDQRYGHGYLEATKNALDRWLLWK